MFGQVIGAIVGGVAGGIINGYAAYKMNQDRVNAYKKAAEDVRKAAEKYSGQNAYNTMQNAGNMEATNVNRNTLAAGGQMDNAFGTPAMNVADLSNANGTMQGYTLGANNAKTDMDAKYYRDTALARTAMKQADIDYKTANQTAQTVMNTASGLADVYKNIKPTNKSSDKSSDNTPPGSDENIKEGINNESGLPESDIEDSMRQLETISYKYKDPSVPGCDGEKHESGFTAQSAEKTPLFGKAVETGDDGIKRIDQWKLMESLTAGIAQLQREIDELEGNNGNKVTSDERMKKPIAKTGRRINE